MNKIRVNRAAKCELIDAKRNNPLKQYLYSNCFLLFIPVILFNMVFTKHLPEQYLNNISHVIVPIESTLRIILIAFSAMMSINIKDKIGKIGISIYITGLIIYFLSYFIVINYQDTIVCKHIIIQLSGYWTAIIWLIGIGLAGNKLFVKMPYHWSFFLILSILFGLSHTYHGYILMIKL
jgi:hypothetical protein